MLHRKLPLAFAMILGSFAVYCTQSAIHGADGAGTADGGPGQDDGSFIDDANAQTMPGACCALTAPTFTTLAEKDLAINASNGNPVAFTTSSVDVSAYREVVVLVSLTGGCTVSNSPALFQAPGSSVFGSSGQLVTEGGRLRVDGPQLELRFNAEGPGAPCSGNVHYVVEGVGLK
jgi:hypothetical protein